MALDWGIGRYELMAADLAPAAEVVVQRAGVRAGERALDLGCGTGNAAIELARAGAVVTAVDPSPRLLEVAGQRATAAGVAIDPRPGEAAAIPLDDGSADLIVSVFAVFLAPDPAAAIAEMRRVLAPGGRILLTAWVPGVGIGKAYAALGPVLAAATGAAPPERFPWHDLATLEQLADPHGLSVSVEQLALTFAAASPEAQVELDAENHPVWLDAIAQLRAAGADESVAKDAALAALRDINEDPAGFRATSHYVIATLR
jgi:SAM-dependent methyltransferase